jgi:hypothetical protein
MRKLFAGMACLMAVALAAQLVGCGGKTKTDDAKSKSGEETAGKADAKVTPGKQLHGVWVAKPEPPPGVEIPPGMDLTITMEFKEDGKMSGALGDMVVTGVWKVLGEEGGKLTINTELDVPTEAAKEGAKPKTKKDVTKFVVEFKGADRAILTPQDKPGDNKPMTFDRKKKLE